MARASLKAGLDPGRLRFVLLGFFLALALPTGVLVYQAYSQLKWEAFHQHQVMAQDLARRIDSAAARLIDTEEARPFRDYAFLVTSRAGRLNVQQRSPLAAYPAPSALPGLIGYFQVDTAGVFSTPLLPPSGERPRLYGLSGVDLERRLALRTRMLEILARNRLVQGGRASPTEEGAALAGKPAPGNRLKDAEVAEAGASLEEEPAAAPAEKVMAQAAFDQLAEAASPRQRKRKQEAVSSLGRVDELNLQKRYPIAPVLESRAKKGYASPLPGEQAVRKAQAPLPRTGPARADTDSGGPSPPALRVDTFESAIDPFQLRLLDSGHFVLFRKVWHDGQRYVQGALLERESFIRGLTETAFRDAALARMSNLIIAYQGDVLTVLQGQGGRRYLYSAAELSGELLYQTALSTPLSDLQLIFSINRLPAGAAGTLVTWVAIILVLVLCGGFYLMYRLGLGQIELARQQQDFVSAVSHELKTPLTSIRMYGEMLREGWATEEKKRGYYEYIHDESERLSRLIDNVLQLARMTRNELRVEFRPVTVAELMDGVRSKVSSQVARAGFSLDQSCDPDAAGLAISVDTDGFAQIMINLVDNALKFSARAEHRQVDIRCHRRTDKQVVFSVRDYGPGVPRGQMKKIFRLFYRSGNELTRETVGTGIGLALVHQLALAMHGRVDVIDAHPGAEFRVTFLSVSSELR